MEGICIGVTTIFKYSRFKRVVNFTHYSIIYRSMSNIKNSPRERIFLLRGYNVALKRSDFLEYSEFKTETFCQIITTCDTSQNIQTILVFVSSLQNKNPQVR